MNTIEQMVSARQQWFDDFYVELEDIDKDDRQRAIIRLWRKCRDAMPVHIPDIWGYDDETMITEALVDTLYDEMEGDSVIPSLIMLLIMTKGLLGLNDPLTISAQRIYDEIMSNKDAKCH